MLLLYIVPSENPNVYVQIAGESLTQFSGIASQVTIDTLPTAWEMSSSSIVEDKGVHVWSDSADLSVYFLSYNLYTTEGTAILPCIGWGTEYVVASYESLFLDSSIDYPSECAVVANQDNAILTILPSTDIRSNSPYVSDATILHPRGVVFYDTLNAGQVIQYKAMFNLSYYYGYDLTGTVIDSNVPVGVVGASACTNIPIYAFYSDYVCEMMQPVRTWTNVYYTIPLFPRDSVRVGDTFLVIPTEDGQAIYADDTIHGDHIFCVGNWYKPVWNDTVYAPTKWHSATPFELVQYENGGQYARSTAGDPAEVVINGCAECGPSLVFQTPTPFVEKFTNFANIIIQTVDEKNVYLDGQPIDSNSLAVRIPLPDSVWEGWEVSDLAPGVHTILGDSGIGLYMYGYGDYDSYAWSGHLGVSTFVSQDRTPPLVQPSNTATSAQIQVGDAGADASGLSSIILGNSSNMTFAVDPKFVTGSGVSQSSYTITVEDNTKPASINVFAYDLAGNKTSISSKNDPQASVATSDDPNAWLSANDGSNATIFPVNPNPASVGNSTISVTIGMKKSGPAKIDLFDVVGRQQATVLNDENHAAGILTIKYSTSGMLPGTYYVRLDALGEVHEGKFVVE